MAARGVPTIYLRTKIVCLVGTRIGSGLALMKGGERGM